MTVYDEHFPIKNVLYPVIVLILVICIQYILQEIDKIVIRSNQCMFVYVYIYISRIQVTCWLR